MELLYDPCEGVHKTLPIDIVVEDIFAPITPSGDVIERVWKLDADGTGHGPRNSMGMLQV